MATFWRTSTFHRDEKSSQGLYLPARTKLWCTLQRRNTENTKQIFPEKELCGLSPNFHIHVSVSDLYIPRLVSYSAAQKYVLSCEYINRSQAHECGNWDYGRAIPRKGIHK
jgi:hypothetical protein